MGVVRLGVNIDHIATVRQARGVSLPDPVEAALLAESGGANGIVAHLREDRRHIQDRDIYQLKKRIRTRLDLEMAATPEMVGIALKVKPALVTLVPEKRQELTTEGGLAVVKNLAWLKKVTKKLRSAGIPVSLFVEPIKSDLLASRAIGAAFVELHTGAYANAQGPAVKRELARLRQAAILAHQLGLRVNAGHGLDYRNTGPIARLPHIEELNIGHSIIGRAVLVGIKQAVAEMKSVTR